MRYISLVLLASFISISALNSVAAESEPSAKGLEIAQERKARDRGWNNSEAEILMVLRNAQGQEATRKLNVKSMELTDDGDKALTVFQSPRDVKGTAFLSFSHVFDADEQWIFLPALKRVKRIASKK